MGRICRVIVLGLLGLGACESHKQRALDLKSPDANVRPGLAPIPQPLPRPKRLWQRRFTVFESTPVAADVIVGINEQSTLGAVDLRTGRDRWTIRTNGWNHTVLAGEVVLVNREGGVVEAHDAASGSKRWAVKVPCHEVRWLFASGGKAIALCGREDSTGWAIELQSGRRLWSGKFGRDEPTVKFDATRAYVAAARDVSRHGKPTFNVSAYDWTSGRCIWTRTVDGESLEDMDVNAGVVVALGYQVHAFDAASGQPRWTYASELKAGVLWMLTPHQSVTFHDGLVLVLSKTSIEGVDVHSGHLVRQWDLPVELDQHSPHLMGRIYPAGDRLLLLAERIGTDPGYLVVWKDSARSVLQFPPYNNERLFSVVGDLLVTETGQELRVYTLAATSPPESLASSVEQIETMLERLDIEWQGTLPELVAKIQPQLDRLRRFPDRVEVLARIAHDKTSINPRDHLSRTE